MVQIIEQMCFQSLVLIRTSFLITFSPLMFKVFFNLYPMRFLCTYVIYFKLVALVCVFQFACPAGLVLAVVFTRFFMIHCSYMQVDKTVDEGENSVL